MIRTRSLTPWAVVAGVVLAMATVPACSDDPSADSAAGASESSADGATETVRAFVLAFDERDGRAFVDQLSAKGCKDGLGESCASLRSHGKALFEGQPAIEIRSLEAPIVKGQRATIEATTRIQSGLHHSHFALTRGSAGWLIDGFSVEGPEPLPIPRWTKAVDVTVSEYEFALDEKALESGEFALKIHNAGTEQHELTIKRVDVEAELPSGPDPGGVPSPANRNYIPVAGVDPIDPGADATLVLAEQLPPGHYFLFCELPDAHGTSHLEHGMAAEFTVAEPS